MHETTTMRGPSAEGSDAADTSTEDKRSDKAISGLRDPPSEPIEGAEPTGSIEAVWPASPEERDAVAKVQTSERTPAVAQIRNECGGGQRHNAEAGGEQGAEYGGVYTGTRGQETARKPGVAVHGDDLELSEQDALRHSRDLQLKVCNLPDALIRECLRSPTQPHATWYLMVPRPLGGWMVSNGDDISFIEVTEIEMFFAKREKEGKLVLQIDEVQSLLTNLGHTVPRGLLEEAFLDYDAGFKGGLTQADFIRLVEDIQSNVKEKQRLLETFAVLDVDDTGFIDGAYLRTLLCGDPSGDEAVFNGGEAPLTEAEFTHFMNEARATSDGRLDYRQFVNTFLFKNPVEPVARPSGPRRGKRREKKK